MEWLASQLFTALQLQPNRNKNGAKYVFVDRHRLQHEPFRPESSDHAICAST